MLGGYQGCAGPVSWWCSEVWWCSPRVAPGCATTGRASQMADCDQCNAKFSILKRKKTCGGCGLVFCASCIRRGIEGSRRCNKCLVLSQWPLDTSQVEALRVKDLRQFLHSRHINTVACKEKRDLIDLVTRHICSQHSGSGGSSHRSSAPPFASSGFSPNGRPHSNPATSPVTRDDGIRVRACNSPDASMGSIRVRPMDSIRVRPISPESSEYDPENDLGIRVFASEYPSRSHRRESSVSPVSVEGQSESVEEECSRCPSEDCTASCCSLDSCPNGASSQPCTHNKAERSSHCSLEDVSASSESQVPSSTSPDLPPPEEGSNSFAQDNQSQSIHNPTRQDSDQTSSASPQDVEPSVESAPGARLYPEIPMEVDPPPPTTSEEEAPVPTATTPSSASSSTFPSGSSSPEPTKQFGPGIVSLSDLKSEEDIRLLSIRQCKELLAFHRVNLSGVREKSELIHKIAILWKDFQTSQQDVEGLPEELVCKICMDRVIDCVLLECGHMVACTLCGKQMAECPVCRQFVVRVVRTFRA